MVDTSSKPVWLISGCSSGFGDAIARAALKQGHLVIATCRGNAETRLAGLGKAGASSLSLDVTSSPSDIFAFAERAFKVYGRLDVLVNNAGYLLHGAHEELTHQQELAEYQTNVFGAFKLTRAVLPFFRRQRSGIIFNMTSHCGRFARQGYGSYSGTKFALEGFSESLANETRHLGISVCALEPGAFHTLVLDSNVKPQRNLDDYASVTGALESHHDGLNGNQRGDPNKAGDVLVDLVVSIKTRGIPIRLALGSDAYASIKKSYEEGLELLEEWKDVTLSTDKKSA